MIIALVILLGVLMYNWTLSQVKKSSEDLEKRTDESFCVGVSFNVDEICQNSQILYINITNTQNIKIEKLHFRLIDLYGNSESKEKEISLYPDETEIDFDILKQGTLSNVKITPIVKKEGQEIFCQEQSVEKEDIAQC